LDFLKKVKNFGFPVEVHPFGGGSPLEIHKIITIFVNKEKNRLDFFDFPQKNEPFHKFKNFCRTWLSNIISAKIRPPRWIVNIPNRVL
jgi:hypothetical protein